VQNKKKKITVKVVSTGPEFSFGEYKKIKNIFLHKRDFIFSDNYYLSEGDLVEGVLKLRKGGKYSGKYKLTKCKKKKDNFLERIRRNFLCISQ